MGARGGRAHLNRPVPFFTATLLTRDDDGGSPPLCEYTSARREALQRPPLRAQRPYAPHCVGPLRVCPPRPQTTDDVCGDECPRHDRSRRTPVLPRAVAVGARPPAEFVRDNGRILLELLRGRAQADDGRSFVSALRRLRGGAETPEKMYSS